MPVRNSRCSPDVAMRLMEIAGTARISTLNRGDAAPVRLVYSRTKNRSEGGTRATDESFRRYVTACADGSSRTASIASHKAQSASKTSSEMRGGPEGSLRRPQASTTNQADRAAARKKTSEAGFNCMGSLDWEMIRSILS